ncbi:MAG: flavodoxin domain-containing protein [Mobilitalea sp.]
MENAIVLYNSSTGFSQKYAEWIAEELSCKALSIKDVNINELINCKTIIFGGGLHAGHINGLKAVKNSIMSLKNKNIVIFATGATPEEALKNEDIINTNFSSEENEIISFFYFQSGINYEKMSIGNKGMMGIFKTVLRFSKEKTPEEQGMSDTITCSNDHSNKEYIKPLIEYLKLK